MLLPLTEDLILDYIAQYNNILRLLYTHTMVLTMCYITSSMHLCSLTNDVAIAIAIAKS
jgi:hypothetical protein